MAGVSKDSRALDAKVARDIFGLRDVREGNRRPDGTKYPGWEWVYRSELGDTQPVPDYHTWYYAGVVIERMRKTTAKEREMFEEELKGHILKHFGLDVDQYDTGMIVYATPEWICLAALAAIGGGSHE